ncbi:MAG: transporter [Confluentimicrobium sp.]|uniref:H+/gluconate symporter-like permease n=1 Tax=Actibacterium naphthalenivorans TaxID=1614693 RepID=A0A840CDE2_9RHOB|nr:MULTISPECIES: GntP family permease [Actibacterium]ALG92152.1 transporter [Actibacterium sp. EMB200-NS6]MBB4024111.1 H+/gluconate symporter-like permease [Actibacterium naphthalenivorans]MBC58841.1 transporter [Actibacterium sp.]|tara:strand:+ start:1463 stop:2821 length:1359 start_codon:yes stop_codon:yes gene_type:complete
MAVLLILLALGLLIAGAWAGLSVLVLAPLLAVLAALAADAPVLAAYTQVFMEAAGGFVVSFFPLFLLGALFGKVMDASGAAQILARAIATAVGPANAILAVVLACAVLTYGGVSLFVVAFVAWPLARALFAETGLPARLIPATIALGAFTFTMTALPGTPSIQNAIPMATFGTTPFAAPGLGLIAAAAMLGLGMIWLRYRARALQADTPPVMPPASLGDVPMPLWAAVAPILSVGVVTLAMGWMVLPALQTGYLALPQYGETDLARVGGLWSVITALTVALVLALVLSRPPELMKTLNEGAESALLPLFNTASLVGFGAVIATLPGFEVLRQGLDGLAGGNVVVTAALSSGALAGITGSASGGMSIALDVLGPSLMAQAVAQSVDPALLHRVVSVATGGLDTLPHNGAVITLLGICGMTHRQAYGDIFMVAVLAPILACALIIVLGSTFGSF